MQSVKEHALLPNFLTPFLSHRPHLADLENLHSGGRLGRFRLYLPPVYYGLILLFASVLLVFSLGFSGTLNRIQDEEIKPMSM